MTLCKNWHVLKLTRIKNDIIKTDIIKDDTDSSEIQTCMLHQTTTITAHLHTDCREEKTSEVVVYEE